MGGRVDERAFYSHLQVSSVNIFDREGFQSPLKIEVFNTGRIESIIASAVFDKSRPASVRQAIRPSGRIKSVNFNITKVSRLTRLSSLLDTLLIRTSQGTSGQIKPNESVLITRLTCPPDRPSAESSIFRGNNVLSGRMRFAPSRSFG